MVKQFYFAICEQSHILSALKKYILLVRGGVLPPRPSSSAVRRAPRWRAPTPPWRTQAPLAPVHAPTPHAATAAVLARPRAHRPERLR